MLDTIIKLSFYLLFLLAPLVWTPLNFELFEYNKMMFVYLLTVIITASWILKMLIQKKLLIRRTPLDIPLLLFLGSQILSTIFSIDPHTSIFGYYSRSNGGLLSIFSYILLYYALVSNFEKTQVFKFLKAALIGGGFVALWAIPEHFGVSPSCAILRQELTANCWIQDVQARVFATLGQPNWLAAYLAMLIFPSLYFYLATKNPRYLILTTIYYLAFTFTYSRGATLGILMGLLIFLTPTILVFHPKGVRLNLKIAKPLLILLGVFLLINLTYGSAITRFQLTKLSLPTPPPANPAVSQSSSLTQLENEGTESGQIRLIVWQGAWEIFKHYPIFGSGVETFAYSYYQFRPVAHNLVSEWDFLYNKAHNEFLNYLATTGLVGFLSYMALIVTFIIWGVRNIKSSLLVPAILASYTAYLIQNFFGFSVVVIATLFYLLPGIVFIQTGSTWPLKIPKISLPKPLIVVAKILTPSLALVLVLNLSLMWRADTFFASGEKDLENGHSGLAYEELAQARLLNSLEPYYKSELGYVAAEASLALKDTEESTLSATLLDQAINETSQALQMSPKNTSFWRTAIRTYYIISAINPDYIQKTLDTIDQTITLAPTDPKLYYNKAIILGSVEKNDEAIDNLQKAINLKPNYRDAYYGLGLFYFDQKKSTEAVEAMNKVLKLIPNDPEALGQLNTWGKQGIATQSANQP